MKLNSKHHIIYGTLIFSVLFSCLRPAFFSGNNEVKIFQTITLISVFVITVARYLRNIKQYKFTTTVSLFFISLLIPTLIYNPSLDNLSFFVKTYLSIWSLAALTEMEIMSKRRDAYLKTISLFSLLAMAVNIYFILHFGPNYLGDRIAFLGYDNTVLPFILFSAIIAFTTPMLVKNKTRTSKLRSIANIILVIVNCLIVRSANAKIAVILILLFAILYLTGMWKKKSFNKVVNFRFYTIISILIFLSIVIFGLQFLFEDIIVNTLDRNLTFTGRTYIWSNALDIIQLHPLIGVGTEDFSVRLTSEYQLFHAHSTYLNIALEGGIIAIMFYLNIFRKTWATIKNYISDLRVIILSYGAFIYFVISTIEYYRLSHMFMAILAILFCIPQIIVQEKKRKSTEKGGQK